MPEITTDRPVVNIWVMNNLIYVGLTYANGIPNYEAFLILNSVDVGPLYESMGYSTANTFTNLMVSSGPDNAPTNIVIPATSFSAVAYSQSEVVTKISSVNFATVSRAIRF